MAAPFPIGSEPTAEAVQLVVARLSALPRDLWSVLLLAARLAARPEPQPRPRGSAPATR
jgi:hypothetical protein